MVPTFKGTVHRKKKNDVITFIRKESQKGEKVMKEYSFHLTLSKQFLLF